MFDFLQPSNSSPDENTSGASTRHASCLRATRECSLVLRLGKHVHMIRLHRVLDHPEARARDRRERRAHELVRATLPHRWQPASHAQRHEHRKPRREPRTLRVRPSRPLTARFVSRPRRLPPQLTNRTRVDVLASS